MSNHSYVTSYSPSGLIEWMHDRDRFGQDAEITRDTDYESWIRGIAINAGFFVVLGVLFFLILLLLYFCACCKCCCFKKDSVGPGKSKRRTIIIFFIIVTGILVLLAAGSMAQVSKTVQGTSDLIDTSDMVTGLADDVKDSADALRGVLVTANATTHELIMELGSSSAEINELLRLINEAASAAQDTSDSTTDSKEDAQSLSEDWENVSDTVKLAGWIYVALSAAWAVMMLITFCKSGICRCCTKVFLILGLFLLLLIWVFTGVVFGSTIAASDVCVAPEATVEELLEVTPPYANGDTSVEASVAYYLYCAENPTMPKSGVITEVESARADAVGASDKVADLAATYSSAGPRVQTLLTELTDLTDSALVLVDRLTSLVQCDSINSIWVNFRDALCDDTTEAIGGLWIAQVLAGLFMLLAIFVSLSFWNNHPSTVLKRQKKGQGEHQNVLPY